MSTTIAGHTLTRAEVEALHAVADYLRRHSGDSHWGPHTSPKGDGRAVPLLEVFSARNNQDNARRRTVARLAKLGILTACEIRLSDGMLTADPLSSRQPKNVVAQGSGTYLTTIGGVTLWSDDGDNWMPDGAATKLPPEFEGAWITFRSGPRDGETVS